MSVCHDKARNQLLAGFSSIPNDTITSVSTDRVWRCRRVHAATQGSLIKARSIEGMEIRQLSQLMLFSSEVGIINIFGKMFVNKNI